MKKFAMVLCGLMLLFGCEKKENLLVGEWVQPIPGMEAQVQGINIEKSGKAESINMHTLVYESWKQDGNKLILTGRSIGNGQEFEFSEVYAITKLDEGNLVLRGDEMELIYQRQGK